MLIEIITVINIAFLILAIIELELKLKKHWISAPLTPPYLADRGQEVPQLPFNLFFFIKMPLSIKLSCWSIVHIFSNWNNQGTKNHRYTACMVSSIFMMGKVIMKERNWGHSNIRKQSSESYSKPVLWDQYKVNDKPKQRACCFCPTFLGWSWKFFDVRCWQREHVGRTNSNLQVVVAKIYDL